MPETPSVYFPDEFVTFPAKRGRKNRTTIIEAQGREQRRPEYPVGGRRILRGTITPLGRDNWQILRDFERARQGRFGVFWIFASNVEKFVDFALGTGYVGYPLTLPFKARPAVAHGSILKLNGNNANAAFDSAGAGGELRAISGGVTTVLVTAGGSGYVTPPTVSFSGGGGSGAVATATINAGAVTGVSMNAFGSGYTTSPTVSFSGGGGTGAAADAHLIRSVDAVTVSTTARERIVVRFDQDDFDYEILATAEEYAVPTIAVIEGL